MKRPLHLVAATALALAGAFGFSTISSASPKLSTIEFHLTCGSGTACHSFSVVVTNGNSVDLTGVTFSLVGQKMVRFHLDGYPSGECKATGVDNAFGCYPISVPPKATLNGTGISATSLTTKSKLTVYTTVDLFKTSVGQTVFPTSGSVTGSTPGSSGGGGGLTVGIAVGVAVLLALAYRFLVLRRRGDGSGDTRFASRRQVRDCSDAEAEVAAAEAEAAGVRADSDVHYHDFGDLTYWGEILRANDGSTSDDDAEVSIARRTMAAHRRLDRAHEVLKACQEGRGPVLPHEEAEPFNPVPPSTSSGDDSEEPRQEIG